MKTEPQREGDDQFASLHSSDERAMRSSVTALALQQARRVSPLWDGSQRDCAGLVRFSYRAALEPTNDLDRRKQAIPVELELPPVSSGARRMLPTFPALWAQGPPVGGKTPFGPFADAETLVGYNFHPVSKELDAALPGDLLVYRRSRADDVDGWHLMIYAGGRGKGTLSDVVVYHNGGGDDGAVRVVRVADLFRSPDPVWVPSNQNDNFLGVYRWNLFSRVEGGFVGGSS
jgi:hypothetical protein